MKLLSFALIACTVALGGCVHLFVDCVHGSGRMATESRSVGAFDGVLLKGSAEVYLTRGETPSVVVDAEDNIVPLIRTAVDGGDLVIDSRRCLETSRPVVVRVTMPQLSRCSVSGSGSISTRERFVTNDVSVSISGSGDIRLWIESREVRLSIAGSGDARLRGSAVGLDATVSGSGDIAAREFPVQRARIRISGSGDCETEVSRSLEATISGSGDIRYSGSVTDVSSSVTGSGSVTRIR